MKESRIEFDILVKELKIKFQVLAKNNWSEESDSILYSNLNETIGILHHLTELYNDFDINILNNSEVVSFRAYRDRASSYMMICQNQFITPLTNELNNRRNELLQQKAEESIVLAKHLLDSANQSSKFAKCTFWIALTLSILSVLLTIYGNYSGGMIMNENTARINIIVNKLDTFNIGNNLQIDKQNIQNNVIKLKLDSILKKSNK